jgi:hypothetical protein
MDKKNRLIETLFDIVPRRDIREMTPNNIKEIPLDVLIDLCILHLDSSNAIMTDDEIRTVLGAFDKPREEDVEHQSRAKPVIKEVKLPFLSEITEVKEKTETQVKEMKEMLDELDQQMKVSRRQRHHKKLGWSTTSRDFNSVLLKNIPRE